MADVPLHRCRVLASPWPGVYATEIASGRHFARHWHDTYGLGFMEDGAHRSVSGSGRVEAFAGDIVATNPGEVHDGQPLGAPSRRWCTVYLPPELVAAFAVEEGRAADVAVEQPAFDDPALRAALVVLRDGLRAWTASRSPELALACEQALVAALGRMLHRHSSATAPDARGDAALRRVFERLADAGAPAPTLAELAALAGLGRFQLLRRFQAACGLPPHAWWLQHRAERARGLIARGLPIAEAAAAAGFSDQSHLHRVFSPRYGFTPGAWRRAAARRPEPPAQ